MAWLRDQPECSLRKLSVAQVFELCGRNANADEKFPEECIHGTDLVKAHFVDQLFEDHWIISEQIYAPLPIIEANRPGNDLFHRSCITAADHPVLFHLALPLLDGKAVPVL